MSWSRYQVQTAWTSIGWTKDFRHLAPVPRHWSQRRSWQDSVIKVVRPRDRIKYWNIVPGDQVRLLGDPAGRIYEVNMINRLSNRVILKTEDDARKRENRMDVGGGKQVPYARCQLFVGRFEFPPRDGASEPVTLPVFASRVATSNPRWLKAVQRYTWERYAANTVPRLPYLADGEKERVLIPWPKKNRPARPDPTDYDTPLAAVAEITYVPPALPSNFMRPLPAPPSEHEYIRAVANPGKYTYDASQAVEVHLAKELSNPHSRAKKQARWQAYETYKRSLLQDMIAGELKELKGRTRREARAEATWKWRQRLAEERKAEMKRRWKNRGSEARLLRKKGRKARKVEKQQERLRKLVLLEAPNQVIPGRAPSESRA
ncbi:hypothetical protein AcV7_007965 [Taiwanofungus camphoratus]|nr:hypothetical protein AcW2_006747 [Antrodia cinnamomea]KAI0952040.1 hypothetical protein AcV7_007965 [Antrodia cinnamomea]